MGAVTTRFCATSRSNFLRKEQEPRSLAQPLCSGPHREAMRRAQPITMLARFAPRQRMASMNELLKRDPLTQQTDPEGSLVDADMGAYYTWINQGRLPGGSSTLLSLV